MPYDSGADRNIIFEGGGDENIDSGLFTELRDTILNFGINDSRLPSYYLNQPGGFMRTDARAASREVFSVWTRYPGVTSVAAGLAFFVGTAHGDPRVLFMSGVGALTPKPEGTVEIRTDKSAEDDSSYGRAGLMLWQCDRDEPFYKLRGWGDTDKTKSLSSQTTGWTLKGMYRVEIYRHGGAGLANGDYWVPLYQ